MADRTAPSMDRLGLEVLSPQECWDLVEGAAIGRVAFVDAGEPVIFPVTHGVHGRRVVFQTGAGSKLEAAKMANALSFEVDAWDAATKSGWSVLVRGVGETVYDDDEIGAFDALGLRPWLESARSGTWVRIRANEITGRRLRS